MTDRRTAAVQPLLIGVWCALAAGLLEALRHFTWRFGLDRLTWLSSDVFWLAPLSYLLLFALPVLALAAVAWLRPRSMPLWLPVLLFVATATFGVLSLVGRHQVSLWALGVLASGIGVQAARFARNRPHAVLSAARRSLPWMGALVVAVMILMPVGRPIRERLAVASLPDAPSGAPNVLLIILDTVRRDNLSVYGYERETTPNLERMASQGVTFENAIAPAPWTLTSHASAFTGRWPHELTADWEVPLNSAYTTLAESLRSRGYNTAGFVANLLYTGRDSGLDRGFLHYSEHQRSLRQLVFSSFLGQTIESWRTGFWPYYPAGDRKLAAGISSEFLEWVSRNEGRPFFAFLNYFEAHQPYLAPREFRELFNSENGSLGRYDAAIAHLDDELGRLFAELERMGLSDNTIVVVTSDHGEQFGEHGLTGHGNSLYGPSLRVPLMIRHPGTVPAGGRIDDLVSLRDLPATLTDLTRGTAEFPGNSLALLWTETPDEAPSYGPALAELSQGVRTPPDEPVSRGPMKSLHAETFHYIRNGDGVDELYDLARDPAELHDLAGLGTAEPVLRRMSRLLDQSLQESEAPPPRNR